MTTVSKKLLVVDDLADWRITIKGVLKDEKYNVATAESIKDAISLLEKEKYALALLDLRLDERDEGNTDGLELAKIIRKHWSKTKIIMVTGYGTTKILIKAMEPDKKGISLVDDYLPKGDTDKLVETVKRVLG